MQHECMAGLYAGPAKVKHRPGPGRCDPQHRMVSELTVHHTSWPPQIQKLLEELSPHIVLDREDTWTWEGSSEGLCLVKP